MQTGARRKTTNVWRVCTAWARTLRRWFARLDVIDLHVRRHPSGHSLESSREGAAVHAPAATVTTIWPEHRFEDLLEEWGRSA